MRSSWLPNVLACIAVTPFGRFVLAATLALALAPSSLVGSQPDDTQLHIPLADRSHDSITIILPGSIPLTLGRRSQGIPPCDNSAGIDSVYQDCYVSILPLTNRQWRALMNWGPAEMHSAEADAPVSGLSPDDFAGQKGFLPALEAYLDKFPTEPALHSLKFHVIQVPPTQTEPAHFLLTASSAEKVLPPVSVLAACGFGNALSLSCSQTRSGVLSSSDCTLSDGSYADVYAFQGTSGQQITINMNSSAFDTYLVLWDPAGNLVASDDDGGTGLNSQLTYTLTATGTWYVGANSLYVASTGNYTISLACGGQPNACQFSTIACNAHRSGTLSSSDCLLGDGSHVDFYQFAGSGGQLVTIDLISADFDTYLALADPDANVVATDDDGGSGTNSRIVYTLPRSGTWTIAANSLQGGVTGSYGLDLQCQTSTQACSYSLGSASASVGPAGGTGSVQLTGSPSGCTGSWSSQSNASWITISGTSSGSGGGTFTLSYSVAANSSTSSRTGSLTIAGRTFTISQSGATSGCIPNGTRACLLNGRFSVTLRYRSAFDNNPADQQALVKSVTGFANPAYETAFFYFNSDSNIEMMVKILDQGNRNSAGQPTIAVLFGSATPLRAELSITDTVRGGTKTYTSPFNSMQGATDFTAFLK